MGDSPDTEPDIQEDKPESKSDLSYSMESKAHSKSILHTAKFPWADVCGFFLGKKSKTGVIISDAIPMFHTALFSPMLEVSFKLVQKYCESKDTDEGTTIVGMYFAPARNNYSGTYPKIKKIAGKVKTLCNNNDLCLGIINNASLADESQSGFTLLCGSAWKETSNFKVNDLKIANAKLTTLLSKQKEDSLCDIESWFEDLSLDWRNTQVVV
mmetsp:Transcript_12484/g.14347  ORF Transcript_12484/g.14347 Transcript_12484/m.14347 type:complete len:212 (+) Transcript_12484:142-777(+)|eukprot:CAMPEP_0184041670 /NCGR_PEP_ID=MMETSP0955-20130417/63524_1 /TAXON_ID=627963 /ORGANISM="Aplanochytrium sp, Strain PBS07" /LENGTH=211 /DNA_ID=CAMNT_0026332091 /DNA_START=84 /DNA_END=719 /DNA_ORIENTATION=+